MSIELYFTFLAAVVLLGLMPGPMFALLISNSMSFGVQAGLRTLAGSVLGLSLLVFSIVLGLTSIVQFMADWFDWVKLAGALYLIWLGFNKIRAPGANNDVIPATNKQRRFFIQGLVVSVSNPKVLLFLAAFLPQFLSPGYDMRFQLMVYGLSFITVVASIDLMCVLATEKTKSFLSQQRFSLFDKMSGILLMCGGVWLLFSRRQ
jgi:threonine/homoserine/homoserine lactone efflux protein